jgi:hypothetical protein
VKINAAMKVVLARTGFSLAAPLCPALHAIAESGFEVRDDCHFLAAIFPSVKNANKNSFPDCTGYESFVNSVHIEDYDDAAPLCQAIQFVDHVFTVWRASVQNLTLMAIVSADDSSVVVKFHVKRPAERWLSENIEGYEDPIMSGESFENVLQVVAELSY